ncbi:MAG: lipid A deacylase LpxR family protein [Phycisphaerales bacterium]
MRMDAVIRMLLVSAALCAPALAEPSPQADPQPNDEQTPTPEELADSTWRVRHVQAMWDNDGVIKPFNESDRHYTNGARIDLALDPSARFEDGVRKFADNILPMDNAKVAAGIVVAQHIYTSYDISIKNPPPGSRPYAGYLYAGFYVQRANERVHDHVELDLGVVGEASGAEGVQKFIHSVFPAQVEPVGWGTQLENEFAVNLRLQRSWRFQKAKIGVMELDAIPRVSVDLGNVFVRASADATVRFGYNLPDEFGPPRILDTNDATAQWLGDWGIYAFARAGGRAVAHNIFLDGNTFENSRSVDKRWLVGELSFGLVARYKLFEAGYAITWLTEEFETQGNGDAYATAFVRLSVRF